MTQDPVLSAAVRLGAGVDALAALAAHVRLRTEDIPADPAVRRVLADIAAELLGGWEQDVSAVAAPVLGLARTVTRQAVELMDNPGRSGGWDLVDPPLLQAIGRQSMSVVEALLAAGQQRRELGKRLGADGAVFLDVGTGAGWLAVALARACPRLHIVGIDIFDAALALARENVVAQGLSERIELRRQDAATVAEPGGYDVVWVPLPFIPAQLIPRVFAAAATSLRPGGWLVCGSFAGPADGQRLTQLLTDLRIVRAGGQPWTPAELLPQIEGAGFAGADEVDRTWAAPVVLYAAQLR